jgi:hypothetical protein
MNAGTPGRGSRHDDERSRARRGGAGRESACRCRRCPVSVPSVRVADGRALQAGMVPSRDRLISTAPNLEPPAVICRGARVQIGPAVLGDPDRGHIHMSEFVGPGDLEGPRALGRPSERLSCSSWCSRINRWVRCGSPAHRSVWRPSGCRRSGSLARLRGRGDPRRPGIGAAVWRTLRATVDRPPADPSDPGDGRDRAALRDEFAAPGNALAHSHPARVPSRPRSPCSCGRVPARAWTWARRSSFSLRSA